MDDIAAQLNQILSDPAQMAQIAQIADSLGFSQQTPKPESPPAQPNAANPLGDLGLDMDALGRLLPLLTQSGKEAQILGALRPFLSEADQGRVDRAIRAAKLSRLAKAAMQELGSGGGLLG